MTRLEHMIKDLRTNVADQFEKRKVATVRYTGQKSHAYLEITNTKISIYISDGEGATEIEHKIEFSENKTILEMFIQFSDIEGINVDLDPHTAPSYNVSSLFYQKKIRIIFKDDIECPDIDGLDIYLSSFYSNEVYTDTVNDAINIVREGRDIEDLELGDLVYVKWLASADLCKKRAGALIESISKLKTITRESVSIGGKLSVSTDTGLSSDVQAISKHWMDLADKYAGLCKQFLEDNSIAMPEVVIGTKTFEDSLTGEEFPLQNIDLTKKIMGFVGERIGDDLILKWSETRGKNFDEYRIYAHTVDFHIPLCIANLEADIINGDSDVIKVTTITDSFYPEYIYKDYYIATTPPTIFYVVAVTLQDMIVKSNKYEVVT